MQQTIQHYNPQWVIFSKMLPRILLWAKYTFSRLSSECFCISFLVCQRRDTKTWILISPDCNPRITIVSTVEKKTWNWSAYNRKAELVIKNQGGLWRPFLRHHKEHVFQVLKSSWGCGRNWEQLFSLSKMLLAQLIVYDFSKILYFWIGYCVVLFFFYANCQI